MQKPIITLLGFLLFFFGAIAIILSIVGLQLSFLTWIDSPSRTFGLVIRLLMLVSGLIIMYLSKMDRSVY